MINNLILMFAKVIEEKELFGKLSRSLTAYESNPTEKNKTEIEFYCALALAKKSSEGKDIYEVMKEHENLIKLHEKFQGGGANKQ